MRRARASGSCGYVSGAVFDGHALLDDRALVVAGGAVVGLVAPDDLTPDVERRDLGPGVIAPGFVDLQVNGGGGLMFNDAPSVETLEAMAAAHARLGATSILPTLITDTPDKTDRAIEAVRGAVGLGVPGLMGLHLEGPHLARSRKGAHDANLIRPMENADLKVLQDVASLLPCLLVTLAPEAATLAQIAALSEAGVIVCLGHTDASYDDCVAAQRAGAYGVTHLFNAMRQTGPRDPGVVGAALTLGGLSAGLIADGIHVHPANIAMALRAKVGPGRVFLVSDAMATAGSDIASFRLNGREITRTDGRLTLADGTLAGADLSLAQAVSVMTGHVGLPLESALAMATAVPADFAGFGHLRGRLAPGRAADFVHLGADGALNAVWQGGRAL